MSYEQAVKDLAPCGIDCARCVSYSEGEVVRLSKALKESLVNFEQMAERTKAFQPVFNGYKEFAEVLEHFSNGNCLGCRSAGTPKCGCGINGCHKENCVNFCFECSKYPCTPNTFNDTVAAKWKSNNDQMQQMGADKFYSEQKAKPRY